MACSADPSACPSNQGYDSVSKESWRFLLIATEMNEIKSFIFDEIQESCPENENVRIKGRYKNCDVTVHGLVVQNNTDVGKSAVDLLKTCIDEENGGLDAVIFGLTCGSEVMEEITAFNALKKELGGTRLSSNSVLIFTHSGRELGYLTLLYHQCHKDNDEALRQVIAACGDKVVKFFANDPKTRETYRKELFRKIKTIKNKVVRKQVSEQLKEMLSTFCKDNDCKNLYLIGRAGNGKSSTGNTILNGEYFGSSDFGEIQGSLIRWGRTEIEGGTVQVFDGPGIRNATTANCQFMKNFTSNIKDIIDCIECFHAFLVVLYFGNRFTDEEEVTMNILKQIFGPRVFKDHCVLVFTNGESFDNTHHWNETYTFESWCQEQSGAMIDLIKDCDNRVVLFHNMNAEKREETLQNLIYQVKRVPKSFTKDMFYYREERYQTCVKKKRSLLDCVGNFLNARRPTWSLLKLK